MMLESEAFVYCWTNFDNNKLYIGVHKGTSDDGYVCSSKPMLEDYAAKPQSFSRQILAYGSQEEMYVFEQALIKAANAHKNRVFITNHLLKDRFIQRDQEIQKQGQNCQRQQRNNS